MATSTIERPVIGTRAGVITFISGSNFYAEAEIIPLFRTFDYGIGGILVINGIVKPSVDLTSGT